MAIIEVKVPDIGDFKDVAIIELLVKPGDTVRTEQSLVTVESDKASMEIPSSASGIVRELKVGLGDKVSEGSTLLLLETAAEAAAPAPASGAPAPAAPAVPDTEPSVPQAAVPAAVTATVAAAAVATAVPPVGPIEVRVPDIGDFHDVAVIEVLVKPGDRVEAEQSLITVESDKASMEIPSSAAGIVQDIKVALGDRVNQGDLVLTLQGATGAAAPAAVASGQEAAPAVVSGQPALAPMPAPSVQAAPAVVPVAPYVAAAGAVGQPHASPTVRKFARELGVPLAEVRGSGAKGRILQEDVQAFTKAVMTGATRTQAQQAAAPAPTAPAGGGAGLDLLPWPKVDFTKFGAIESQPLSRIKKLSGANLSRNWVMIPHVTYCEDADITDLEALRVQLNAEKKNQQAGIKVTMLSFLIKACVSALKEFPDFNASLDGDSLIRKHYYHIGFAADTPNGLVVPVIRNADQKGILEISRELAELSKKARDGKIGPADMTGASFTISSLGGIGGTYFSPIINAPEVAILGVCRSEMKPRWNGTTFEPRLMLPLSLSADHRVIDGASAARFNAYLAQVLADFRRVLL
ncbi:dihydrolipoyllysine-residue acetyltransferase [Brachymonas sp. M4Q-1]|uniref:dihydrolipoyllysine-residue acetyltransferase n=1 Tax=Brachymonas sp. M4Q-1 TaxID=3416906 RepID=UPI003CF9EB8E